MRIFKRSMFSLLLMSAMAGASFAADYGLPANIQDGNILHCFNWSAKDVKAALPEIAAAGFGSVQLSPLQRPDVKATGTSWHDLYRPYDLAFKSSGFCTEQDLKDLCSEAAKYGIKVVVDVVANHVDKTNGYHDPFWDTHQRNEGGCRYDNRYSITHGNLGDYYDIVSENAEVQARGKAYVEFLKNCGVKGIRWDAAKHIATPNEGCGFWSTVTSVPGMWHYGEILNDDGTPVNEYTKYMSITDNRYSNGAAKSNGGIQQGYGGAWAVDCGIASNKLVYWAESHDTYSNDEWSQNVDQATIDRAYACVATRNGATALYLVRPTTKGFNNIKTGKSTSAYKSAAVTAVNKLRNAAGSSKDYCTATGNAFSCTREGVGAVIVMKGSGNISMANGGGYCPAGTYTDMVSGGQFTVTSSTISGNVGNSGIAVIMKDGVQIGGGGGGGDVIDPPVTDGDMWVLGNIEGAAGWSTTPGTGAPMTKSGNTYTAKNVKMVLSSGETKCYFNITDHVGATWDDLNMNANRYGAATEGAPITIGTPAKVVKYTNNVDASACMSWTVSPGTYDITFDASAMTVTVNNAGQGGGGGGEIVTPPVIDADHYILFDGTFSTPTVWAWTDAANCCNNGTWPGDKMTKKDGVWYWELPAGKPVPTQVIISNNGGDKIGSGDLAYVDKATYHQDGTNTPYQDIPVTSKPVVSASPASGTTFSESVTVTLSVKPSATIYYTTDGATPSTSSTVYSSPLTFTSGVTVKTLAVTSDGKQGDVQSFVYTKNDGPIPPIGGGEGLNTDYYKVNPNGQYGSDRTVNVTGHPANNALSNWTAKDMIAQGVARDVAQAMKGVHERPIIDSYAIYAAYDQTNLYLGVQMVYTVWDLGGEGKQPGESKPYNMDGRLMWAFDLDPNKSFDGYISGTYGIWNKEGDPGAKFNNGVDAIWMGSTKPGVGTPSFFTPTPDGHASYDAAYCKNIGTYGYQDGLLPSITNIYGQSQFGFDPSALEGNEGFVDLKGEIAETAHTFYEWKLPLADLGITYDYIKNTGIGVMYLDVYGSSPIGGTPYDKAYFDNVKDSYSQDSSSSKEKEDEDIITAPCARIGKAVSSSAVECLPAVSEGLFTVAAANGTLTVLGAEGNVVVAGIDGHVYYNGAAESEMSFNLASGLYIVNVNGKSVKAIVK